MKSKIIIIGSGGRLGAALLRGLAGKFDLFGFDHAQLDLANAGEIHAKIDTLDFNILINTAAFTNVDLCEKERDEAFRINAEAPRRIDSTEVIRPASIKRPTVFIRVSWKGG